MTELLERLKMAGMRCESFESLAAIEAILREAIAAEREACAKEADDHKLDEGPTIYRDDDVGYDVAAHDIANAIRARPSP